MSHLGTVRVEGDGALDALQGALCNDLRKVAPGRAQYTQLLNDRAACSTTSSCGGWTTTRFDVMPNASNTERVLDAIGGVDVTADRTVLAVQGPRARERLATVAPEAAATGRFRLATASVAGRPALVAGTGYTGEDGVELRVADDDAEHVLAALVGAGVRPPGSARATRCASRPRCRSTATS